MLLALGENGDIDLASPQPQTVLDIDVVRAIQWRYGLPDGAVEIEHVKSADALDFVDPQNECPARRRLRDPDRRVVRIVRDDR